MHRVTRTYADPHRCPDCDSPVAGPTRCAACGLNLSGPVAQELFATLQRADLLLARLRTEPSEQPSAATAAPPRAPAYPAYPAPPPPRQVHRRRWTVPVVLLSLGGLCLAAGALLFVAVAWYLLGPSGRTVVLVGLTGVAAVATWLTARRRLDLAAETLATLTAAFLALDLAGARLAGWVEADGYVWLVVSGLVVAAACVVGVAVLRRAGPTLVLPQLTGALALDIATANAFLTWPRATTGLVVALVGLLGLVALRRLGQPVAAVNAGLVGAFGWLALAGTGLVRTLGRLPTHDVDAVAPLVAAGLLVAPLANPSRLVPRVPHDLRVLGGLLAGWMFLVAGTAWFVDTVAEALVVATVGTVATAALALAMPPRASMAGVLRCLATTLAVGPAVIGLFWLLTLGGAVAAAAAEGFQQGGDDWLREYAAWLVGDGVPTWSAVAAAVAVLAATVTWRRAWVRSVPPLSWATLGLLVAASVVLGHVTYVVGALTVLLAGALLQAAAVVGSARRLPLWVPAAGLAVAALLVATYDAGALGVTALLLAAVAVTVLRRGTAAEALAGGLALPALTGLAGLSLATAAGGARTTAALVGVGATLAVALTVGLLGWARSLAGPGRWAAYAASQATALVLTGAGAAAEAGSDWTAGALSLQAAAAAILGIRHRSRLIGAVASGLGLSALWLRLADADVGTPEAYTLPLAGVVLAFGGWAYWRDSTTRSMAVLAPGLGLAVAPSLVLALGAPVSLRALLVGIACLGLVAVGAFARWQAPLLVGAVAGALLVLAEIAPYAVALSWITISLVGVLLLAAGIAWERLARAGRRTWGHLAELR